MPERRLGDRGSLVRGHRQRLLAQDVLAAGRRLHGEAGMGRMWGRDVHASTSGSSRSAACPVMQAGPTELRNPAQAGTPARHRHEPAKLGMSEGGRELPGHAAAADDAPAQQAFSHPVRYPPGRPEAWTGVA